MICEKVLKKEEWLIPTWRTKKFLRYEKGYGTYTHREAQVFLKIEIETSCHL